MGTVLLSAHFADRRTVPLSWCGPLGLGPYLGLWPYFPCLVLLFLLCPPLQLAELKIGIVEILGRAARTSAAGAGTRARACAGMSAGTGAVRAGTVNA